MEPVSCEKCGEEIPTGERCYGITAGTVDEEVDGFMTDMDSPWIVLCSECMDEADEYLW